MVFLCQCALSFALCCLADDNDEARERDQLRYHRHKERERDRRIARAHPEKRSKLERERDRDVSEKIALGMPGGPPSQESLFDQRLFNQTQVSLFSPTQLGVFAHEGL